MTRNAAEAFAARSGNCLSLVIMTARFAKALDLPVELPEGVRRRRVGARGQHATSHRPREPRARQAQDGRRRATASRVGTQGVESEGLIIDFLPPTDMRSVRARASARTIVVACT
jgi:hypothetical protein